MDYPTGCSWTADSAASPYPSRTGGIAVNAPAACVPATNPGGPLACDDRWGGTLNYTFPATAGKLYQASLALEAYFALHAWGVHAWPSLPPVDVVTSLFLVCL